MVINALLLTVSLAAATNALPSWQLTKDGGGVQVYTRKVAGSALKEFRAVTTVRAPLPAVLALLDDVPGYRAWFADCKEARAIAPGYNYFVNDAPFPIADRDMVIHWTESRDPATGAVVREMHGEADKLPPQKGRVRVPRLDGHWRFTPRADGGVDIEYQLSSDPGGSLPDWAANSAVATAPHKTLLGLKKAVEK